MLQELGETTSGGPLRGAAVGNDVKEEAVRQYVSGGHVLFFIGLIKGKVQGSPKGG